MNELERLIAQRKKLDEEIERINRSNAELSSVVESATSTIVRSPNGGMTITQPDKVYEYSPVSINICIDNSIKNTSNHDTDVSTSLTGGDSALDLLGNIFGKIFN